MTTLKESMYDLWRCTDGDREQLDAIATWCTVRQDSERYAEAAVELAKGGVPIEKIVDCLATIKQSEGAYAFGPVHAAHLVAQGMASFGSAEPHHVLSLARAAVTIAGRRP